jgi:hypothetical protein
MEVYIAMWRILILLKTISNCFTLGSSDLLFFIDFFIKINSSNSTIYNASEISNKDCVTLSIIVPFLSLINELYLVFPGLL